MRYPAYPLITLDPYVSLWSCSDLLNDDNTRLWHGMEKPIYGFVHMDGEHLRFMGAGKERQLPQTGVEFTPLFTRYTFENSRLRLKVCFWSPAILTDVHLMSAPASFIDYDAEILDGREHDVCIELRVDRSMCARNDADELVLNTQKTELCSVASFRKKHQNPLSERGDGIDINWGEFFLAGEDVRAAAAYTRYSYDFYGWNDEISTSHPVDRACLISEHRMQKGQMRLCASDVFAYDDGYAILYLDQMLKGIWTEKYDGIDKIIRDFVENRDALLERTRAWEETLLADAAPYGGEYQKLITAVYRQVLAAHKAVRNQEGEILYMSKECHSNGCINTVDVSYPSMPLFLLYNPELVRGMMAGIFAFAEKPCWQYDFAPHDLGTYPVANGQVYGLSEACMASSPFYWATLYSRTDNPFDLKDQMPVEECGNMILMAYAYLRAGGDAQFVHRNMACLKVWADYLEEKGVVLELQLCTDDFAGHLQKNVNLAVKSCEALFAFGRMSGEERYCDVARDNAKRLTELARNAHGMMLALDNEDSWSLKYNMVWDAVADFRLFSQEIIREELACYRQQEREFGVPLDSRKDFTKSDWMLWASALDETGETTRRFSHLLVAFLDNTRDRIPMTDWFDTVTAHRIYMWHRSVQGGLWMPVLYRAWKQK